MIVDTSAIVAIAADEPESDHFLHAMRSASVAMSSATYLECCLVLDRRRRSGTGRDLDALVAALKISVVPFSAEQAVIARQAYRDFGKGSGHPAGLNFGDCFAYALAIESDEPLLFKRDDFGHTDVRQVV